MVNDEGGSLLYHLEDLFKLKHADGVLNECCDALSCIMHAMLEVSKQATEKNEWISVKTLWNRACEGDAKFKSRFGTTDDFIATIKEFPYETFGFKESE